MEIGNEIKSKDITSDNIKKIGELFPNCLTEQINEHGEIKHVIDFDILKQELSYEIIEGCDERYQFTWPGKKQAILEANTPTTKEFQPCREESVNYDSTDNLYIEGDNLDALKLLQKEYAGKVKMIYIDPPYNTGKKFIYNDKYTQSIKEYKARFKESEIDELDLNGRFHSDWCSMMYPRLVLARNILRDDGVIFISIDDNEVTQLRKMCDEVFGEENFAAQIPWRKRAAKSDVPFGISQNYEWVLVYAKSIDFTACLEGGTRRYYDTDDLPGRPWRINDLTKQTSASERPNSFFTIIDPKTGIEYHANPNRTWAITKETFKKYYAENRIVFPGDYEFLSISKPSFRYFKDDDMAKAGEKFSYIPVSTKLPDEIGMTQHGTREITEMFGQKIFSFPKPVGLIEYFVKMTTAISKDKNAIILDFFSGSATTAHAVMQLNAEDGGNRKFIMVQLPETCGEKSDAYKAGYKNICEIGKERIRRAGRKIMEDNKGKEGIKNLDIGFRVLKCKD